MARSLSNVRILSVCVAEKVSNAVFRRGFAVAAKKVSEESVSGGGNASAAVMKQKVGEESSQQAPWVPDPKTGYYRPQTVSQDIDPAELRAVLLNNN